MQFYLQKSCKFETWNKIHNNNRSLSGNDVFLFQAMRYKKLRYKICLVLFRNTLFPSYCFGGLFFMKHK